MGYICAAICYTYVLVNLGMIFTLCRKRDEFGVVNEMLAACVAVTVTLFFQYVGPFPNYGGMLGWYYVDLKQNYRAIDLFRWLFLWSTLLISFAFPLCLYAYRAVRANICSAVCGGPCAQRILSHRLNSTLAAARFRRSDVRTPRAALRRLRTRVRSATDATPAGI
jgi:hypothetical protein